MMWFDASSQPPPFGERVITDWGGDILDGARILLRRQRRSVWGVIDRKGRLRLRRGCPDRWRPANRPLEPVALRQPPTMPKAQASPPEVINGAEWWRQPGAVHYSPIGSITPREAEGRIMRAIWTDHALDDGRPSDDTPLSWLARMIRKREIEMGIRERSTFAHDRFQPTARDVSDHSIVMTWLVGLPDNRRAVLGMRAVSPPYSWHQIAEELRVSRERARELYRLAMVEITRRANVATLAA